MHAQRWLLDAMCACAHMCVLHPHVHVKLSSLMVALFFFAHNPLNVGIETRIKTERLVSVYLDVLLPPSASPSLVSSLSV